MVTAAAAARWQLQRIALVYVRPRTDCGRSACVNKITRQE
jgi:hypothetical protein